MKYYKTNEGKQTEVLIYLARFQGSVPLDENNPDHEMLIDGIKRMGKNWRGAVTFRQIDFSCKVAYSTTSASCILSLSGLLPNFTPLIIMVPASTSNTTSLRLYTNCATRIKASICCAGVNSSKMRFKSRTLELRN